MCYNCVSKNYSINGDEIYTMKIGIDIDNTCVNTTEAVLEWLAERGVPKKEIKDITMYGLENLYPVEYHKLISEAFESKYMWQKVHLIEGAKENIYNLRQDLHELYFVTSSLPENMRKKINHLKRNLNIFTDRYMFCHTINIQEKQLLDLDIMIDDFYGNLCGKRHYISICLEYPWNIEECKKDNSIILCKDWNQIYSEVCRLNNTYMNKLS